MSSHQMRIFIGYDSREPVGFHVLSYSILRRASTPISISPIALNQLSGIYKRSRGPTESTEFSLSRFLTPYLSGYKGYSLFLDSDMLCLGDIAELFDLVLSMPVKPVYVCQHDYTPRSSRKMDGAVQVKYHRKNWSSLMIFSNDLCLRLTPQYINMASGLDLHQFNWIDRDAIGSLPLEFNYLVGEDWQSKSPPKIIHYTNGIPALPGYESCEYADLWHEELREMMKPCQGLVEL